MVDLVAGSSAPLPFLVIGEVLGIPAAERVQLAAWFRTLLAPTHDGETPAEAVAASVVHRRLPDRPGGPAPVRAGRGPDRDLVRAADAGTLTEQELLSTLFQLVVAGHDTTTSLIGNGVVALLLPSGAARRAPSPTRAWCRRRSRSSCGGTRRCPIRRSGTPSPTWALGDTVIPAGVQVLGSLAAACRDHERYPDAETFAIGRAAAGHLAFGHGIHHCLGARLARLEARIAFAALLRRFPAMCLAVPPTELHWGHGTGSSCAGWASCPSCSHRRGDPTPTGRSTFATGYCNGGGMSDHVMLGEVRASYERAGQATRSCCCTPAASTRASSRSWCPTSRRPSRSWPDRRGHGRTADVAGPISHELMARDTVAFSGARSPADPRRRWSGTATARPSRC